MGAWREVTGDHPSETARHSIDERTKGAMTRLNSGVPEIGIYENSNSQVPLLSRQELAAVFHSEMVDQRKYTYAPSLTQITPSGRNLGSDSVQCCPSLAFHGE